MYAQKKNFRGHLENATHIPLQELNERINELEQFKGKKLSFTVAPVTEVKRLRQFYRQRISCCQYGRRHQAMERKIVQ